MVPARTPMHTETYGRPSTASRTSATTAPIASIRIRNAPTRILMSACRSRRSRRRAQDWPLSARLTKPILLNSMSRRMTESRPSSLRSVTTSWSRSRIFRLARSRSTMMTPAAHAITATKAKIAGSSALRSYAGRLVFMLEHLSLAEHRRRHVDAGEFQLVGELGPDARRLEMSEHLALVGEARLAEHEDVLHGDDVLLHADDLAHRDHAARAVGETRDLDDHVERGADLLAHDAVGQVDAAHQHERLQAVERVALAVGVNGGQRAVVARV